MDDVEMEENGEFAGEYVPLIEAVADTVEAYAPSIQETVMPASIVKDGDEWSGSYVWRIENFSKLPEKHYSERFEVATYYWRLLLFPHGNRTNNMMSAYLDAPEAQYTPPQMSPRAQFQLHIMNQLDPSKRITKDATHLFTQNESDWGFTNFMNIDEVLNPNNGWLVNDTLVIRVDLRVERDEKYNLDARRETGFVGLKNQGATCYMNSLLQYLYNLPFFRTAVYHMPTNENDKASKCLPLALQSLFYKLQYSRTHVSTKDLTKSFGWGTYDAFMQHDVQELNRVLCEKLEEKMKGTRVERVINELFEGHTYNYIDCINVDYRSSRKESFMDLQLDVKGCRNVTESFMRYVEVETMDGPNQYKAEGFGLQDARKGVLFGNMPPVLQLQLKRFEYDFQRDTMIKINDRYEFPELLDLDFDNRRIFAKEADASVRNLYRLHSVLVHSGGVHGGHYYAFIRPDGQRWYKFDDDRVEAVDARRAMDEQFGGEDDGAPPTAGLNNPPLRYPKFSNAYMLVYIRESDWPRIMCETTKEDIAEHLRERLEQEQQEKEARQKMKQEAHLYCTLKIATDKDLVEQIGTAGQYFDLVNYDRLPEQHVFRVKKNVRFSEFKATVEERLGVPVASQRYWTLMGRQNTTIRPHRPLTPDEENLPMMELREHRDQKAAVVAKQSIMDLKLFLETPQRFDREQGKWELSTTAALPLASKLKSELLLFFKAYDPFTEQLRYVGRFYVPKISKVMDVYPFARTMCGWPADAEIQCYEEVKSEPSVMVELMDPRAVLGMKSGAELEHGDILIVQRAVKKDEEASCRFPRASQFLEYIRSRRLVSFKRLEDPKEEGQRLELLREMNYDQVTEALAEKIGLDDPDKIRLTQHNAFCHQPQKNPMRYRGLDRLEAMLLHGTHVNDVLYYEVLDMPLQQLEKLKTLRVTFHNDKTEFVSEHTVRVSREGCVADVLAAVKQQLGPAYANKELRLMEVYNSKVYKVCDVDEGVDSMNDNYWHLRAEEVPEEELQPPAAGERLIYVSHFNQDREHERPTVTNFGDPFILLIRDDEPLADIKQRIQAKLGVADEEYAKWRFAFISVRSPPEFLEDGDVLGTRFLKAQNTQLSDGNYLGLQHEDKAPRRPNNSYRTTYEKAIKIN